ncbi:MAG: hypothetical protein H0T49_05300 [Chloroflexia bacterium]|nr:hypothetical protein [Chloroflexia bacterium]
MLEYPPRHPTRVLAQAMHAEHVWDYELPNSTNVIDVRLRQFRRKRRSAGHDPGGLTSKQRCREEACLGWPVAGVTREIVRVNARGFPRPHSYRLSLLTYFFSRSVNGLTRRTGRSFGL